MTAITFNNANELIWLDLPTKGRWTNKKRQELIQSMCHLTQKHSNKMITIIPDNAPVTPWNDVIQKWKPNSTWLCTCQILTGTNHLRFRLLHGMTMKSIAPCTAKTTAGGQTISVPTICKFIDAWLLSKVDTDFPLNEISSRPSGNLERPHRLGPSSIENSEQADVCNNSSANPGTTELSHKTRDVSRKPPSQDPTLYTSDEQRVKRVSHRRADDGTQSPSAPPAIGVTVPEFYPACPNDTQLSGVFSTRQTHKLTDKAWTHQGPSFQHHDSNEISYPTDARVRQQKKDKEIQELTGEKREVIKKKKKVEDHYDDCGDDLSSIVADINVHYIDESDTDDEDENIFNNFNLYYFYGSENAVTENLQLVQLSPEHFY
jgi:hypothetical protein